MRIKVSSIIAIIVFSIMFITLPYFSLYQQVYTPFSVIVIGLYLLLNIKLIIRKENRTINILLFLFVLSNIITLLINKFNFMNLIYFIKIIEGFFFFEVIVSKKQVENVITLYYKLLLLFVLLSDTLLCFFPSLYVKYHVYLIGNKFYLAYTHILLLVFLLWKNIEKKTLFSLFSFILLLIISIFISIRIDCMTGLIGIILYIILIIFRNKNIMYKLTNQNVVIGIFLIFSFLLFIVTNLLENRFVIQIIKIFNGDVTLTGRTYIYANLFSLLKKNLMFGVGYGNSHNLIYEAIKAPNTQNGLFQLVLYFGIVGTLILICIFYHILKINNKNKADRHIILYIIIISVLSMVEITFDLKAFMIFAIIYAISSEKNINKGEAYETKKIN